MLAVGLDFASRRLTHWRRDPPRRTLPDHVLFRVHQVGVCGTDRDLATFQFGFPPAGSSVLTLGHEALGQVLETGAAVTSLQPGDWVVPMIRRSCSPPCRLCASGRRDLCTAAQSLERGIFGLDGYFTPFAVDVEADLVRVPAALCDLAVLIEPLSVVEKAVVTAFGLHPDEPRSALVLGAGPIGLLAAMALRLRGLDVTVSSLEPAFDPRVSLLFHAGVRWQPEPESAADIVLEATGDPQAGFRALSLLAPNGVCGLLGSRNGSGPMPFLDMIVRNQRLFGSVNASPAAFQKAVADLAALDRDLLKRLLHPLAWSDYPRLLDPPPGAVKVVHILADPGLEV